MGRRVDLEFPDFDGQLRKLRQLGRNPRKVAFDGDADLRAYIKGLRALNAELSNLLKRFLRDQSSSQKRRSTRTPYRLPASRLASPNSTEESCRAELGFPRRAGSAISES